MSETDCKCGKDSPGWTEVRCCNLCGKSVEPFWKVPDDVAAYRTALKKKIEAFKYDVNIPLNQTQLGHNGALNYVLLLIDQTTIEK